MEKTLALFELINRLSTFRETCKEALPFHLNIIDELHANENAHTRILAKLFQYKVSNKFVFLEHFFECVEIDVTPHNPRISVEKDRIDCLIEDDDFVVILENKVNYAADQPKQIERYISITRNQYDFKQIHVIYLTRFGEKQVSESSLPTCLKTNLGKQFYECSYRCDILPWLENRILPACSQNEIVLKSAVQQYIDYIKGWFFLRKDLSNMDKEIKQFLRTELKMTNNIVENENILDSVLAEVTKLHSEIFSLRIEQRDYLRRRFLTKLYTMLIKAGSWEPVTNVFKSSSVEKDANHQYFGFRNRDSDLQLNNKSNNDIFISIEIQRYRPFLCGIFIGGNEILASNLVECFEERGIKMSKTNYWVYLDLDEYEFEEKKIGWNLYDDKWNKLYANNSESIEIMFFNKIMLVVNTWKRIIKDNKG